MAILRRHLLDKVPVSDLCEEPGLQPTAFYRWQKEFFENGAAAFQSFGNVLAGKPRRGRNGSSFWRRRCSPKRRSWRSCPRDVLNRSTSPAHRLLAHLFSQVNRKVPQLDIAQALKLVHRRLVGSSPLQRCSPTDPAPVSTSLLKRLRTSGRRFARSSLAGAFAGAFAKMTPFAGAIRARRASQSLLLWRSTPTWRRWTLFVAET